MHGSLADQRGYALTLVLGTFLLIGIVGLGTLSLVTVERHGAVAAELAMQATHVAEAGVHYAAAILVRLAEADSRADEAYRGEPGDVALEGPEGRAGTFHVTVACAYPAGTAPPACQDDPVTASVDERDLRVIVSTGYVPGRPGRARRQLVVTVRRYVIGQADAPPLGICGRERVEVSGPTAVTADIGSNGDVVIDTPRAPAAVRRRPPRAPATAPVVEPAAVEGARQGLTGAYSWRVTFVDRAGRESGGSPPTLPARLNGEHARLVAVPLGEEDTVRRRLYRSHEGAARGPWFLVGELADNTSREFVDMLPDEALRHRIPGGIEGTVTAGGTAYCAHGCAEQVEGRVRDGVRAVVCPRYVMAPIRGGREPPPHPLVQTATRQTVRWGDLHVEDGGEFAVETLSDLGAELHVHVREIRLGAGAVLAVSGPGTVYFHVEGGVWIGPGAVFGASDYSGSLVQPPDRVQVLVAARDPSLAPASAASPSAASVRVERDARMAALLFGPDAHIVVDRADALVGGIYGRTVRLIGVGRVFADPVEGLGSERVAVRPTPFQYVLRWYDDPVP